MKAKNVIVLLAFLLPSHSVISGRLDGRVAIEIPAKYKPSILADMRQNLAVVRGIINGVSFD